MVDPVSDIVVNAAASIFLERLSDRTYNWILKKYEGHPKKSIENAIRRADRFYEQFAICIEELKNIDGIEEIKEKALAEPGYTSVVQEAALGATLTDSTEAHKILAHLVTDRLTAEPDSLQNLAAHMACNAVPQLSNMHLKFLGLLYIIRRYRAPPYIMELPYDERIDIGTKWFLNEIAPFIPIEEITDFDLAHLMAVSCITYVPQMIHSGYGGSSEPGYWTLPIVVRNKLCSLKEIYRLPKPVKEPQIEQDPIGKDLLKFWGGSNMRKASLTPAGSLIGLYVLDAISQEHRCI